MKPTPATRWRTRCSAKAVVFTTALCNGSDSDLVAGFGVMIDASALCFPAAVALDSTGNLYAADSDNNRMLAFNTPLNASSGEPGAGDTVADRELGQMDLVHNMENFGGAQALELANPSSTNVTAANPAIDATPTATATPSATATPTPSATATPAPTPTPASTPTISTPTPTPTPVPGGRLSVASSLTFGPVGIGVSPKTEVLKVHNLHRRKTLTVSLAALAPPFALLSGTGPFAIAPLHAKSVRIEFTPAAAGRAVENLNLISSDPRHPTFTVALAGRGAGGHLTVNLQAPSPPATLGTLVFGAIPENMALARRFSTTNTGLGVLTGSVDAFAGGSPFSLTLGGGAFTLLPGQNLKIGVRFAPTAAGKASGTLTITDDAPGTPPSVSVLVTGRGKWSEERPRKRPGEPLHKPRLSF